MRLILKATSVLIIILFFISMIIPIFADSNISTIVLHTYTDATNQYYYTPAIIMFNKIHIKADDALILSGYDSYSEEYGKIIFQFGYHKVELKGKELDVNGTFYYPLQELMDVLSTSYQYDEESETLIFITCKSYFENLIAECDSIFNGEYNLDFYEGTGWQVAGVYEIFSGLRVDALWGGYQEELYEDTVKGIIDPNESDMKNVLKQGDSIMSKLSKLLEISKKDINGLYTYADFLGTNLDGVIEAYDILNKLVPGVGVKEGIEILDYVLRTEASADAFPNAVKYGLVENPYTVDICLNTAAKKVYSMYDDNKSKLDVVLSELFNDVTKETVKKYGEDKAKKIAENFTMSLIKSTVGEEYGGIIINKAYIKGAKLVFDEVFGMKERSTAIMQTVAARNIQEAARLQYELNNGTTSVRIINSQPYASQGNRDALKVKYSTILYLRACNYAYSKYKFDSTMSGFVDYWLEKSDAEINNISTYSDYDLTNVVNNRPFSTDTLNKIIAEASVNDRILACNELIDKGEYLSALKTLYNGYSSNSKANKRLDQAIEDFFNQFELGLTYKPGFCDSEHHFIDEFSINEYKDSHAKDAGIVLRNKSTNDEETIAIITTGYEDYWTCDESDLDIRNRVGDTFMMNLYYGAGNAATYMYTIHNNNLIELNRWVTVWEFYSDYLIGSTFAYDVGSTSDIFIYDWDGRLLYNLQDVVRCTLRGKELYYMSINQTLSDNSLSACETTIELRSVEIPGKNDKHICDFTIYGSGYAYMDGDNIHIVYFNDTGYEEKIMSIDEAHDLSLLEKDTDSVPKSSAEENKASWKIESPEAVEILNRLRTYFRIEYPDLDVTVRFYADYDGMITCYIDSNNALPYGGADIDKATKIAYFYLAPERLFDTVDLNQYSP